MSQSLQAIIQEKAEEYLQTYPSCIDLYPILKKEFEKAVITAALKHSKGNQSQAANRLGAGMNRSTLMTRIKNLDIQHMPNDEIIPHA